MILAEYKSNAHLMGPAAESLKGLAYSCLLYTSALECILSENYDLIVLDLNLPGMDLSLIHI